MYAGLGVSSIEAEIVEPQDVDSAGVRADTHIHLNLLAVGIFDGRVVGLNPDILHKLRCSLHCFSVRSRIKDGLYCPGPVCR